MTVTHALADLCDLEFTDKEVDAVLARVRRRRSRSRRRPALALAALAAVAVGIVAAVPAGRAGLSDAVERFFAGGPTPGASIPQNRLPHWLAVLGSAAQPRVLARSGGERLIAYRAGSGDVCFNFGDHVGVCSPSKDAASWFLDGQPLTAWGPTNRDASGRWILWGIALDSVKRVELQYTNSPPTSAPVTNGFVLRANQDAKATATTLIAFGADGRELASVDVRKRFALAPVGG